jgi:gamma-glutamyltranspeptidase
LGSPGGPTIINTVLEVIVNVLDFGMNVQGEVAAIGFHNGYLEAGAGSAHRGHGGRILITT